MGEKNDFSRVLQDAKQLPSRVRVGNGLQGNNIFLPPLQRSLAQIESISSNLLSQNTSKQQHKLYTSEIVADSKAAILLASKGYDLGGALGGLKRLDRLIYPATLEKNGMSSLSSLPPHLSNRNLPSLLCFELDQCVLKIVDASRSKINHFSENFLQSKFVSLTEASARQPTRSKISTTTLSEERFSQSRKIAYANSLRENNENIIGKKSLLDLSNSFSMAARNSSDQGERNSQVLTDSWSAVCRITHINWSNSYEKNVLFDAQNSISCHKAKDEIIISGALRHLELTFVQHIDRTLAQYPRDALLGGIPSPRERIRAFCELRTRRLSAGELARVELVNGVAVWMLLFCLVRGGLVKEALLYATSIESILSRSDPLFIAYLKAFSEGILKDALLQQLQVEYVQKVNAPRQDVFKIALLKAIGKCDLARRTVPIAIATTEDYMWLQLHLIGTEQNSVYTLKDLQRIILDFGPRHFDPKQTNPWPYFQVLLLTGLFSRAIEHLYLTDSMDALHFALALAQANCLDFAPPHQIAFSRTPHGQITVNLGLLVSDYVTINCASMDTFDAIHYLLLLNSFEKCAVMYQQFLIERLTETVLHSGDYAALLGDVRSDGSVAPGLLSRFAPMLDTVGSLESVREGGKGSSGGLKLKGDEVIHQITLDAAIRCDEQGRFREALQLFNLAKSYEKVVEVLCTRLARIFSQSSFKPVPSLATHITGSSHSDDVMETIQITESVLSYYRSQPQIILSRSNVLTCTTLLRLVRVRRLTDSLDWTAALDELLALDDLLPLETDLQGINVCADRSRDLPERLVSVLSDLVLLAMTTILQRHKQMASTSPQQGAILRRMARNLMTFVGMLRIRIPSDTYAALVRLDASME